MADGHDVPIDGVPSDVHGRGGVNPSATVDGRVVHVGVNADDRTRKAEKRAATIKPLKPKKFRGKHGGTPKDGGTSRDEQMGSSHMEIERSIEVDVVDTAHGTSCGTSVTVVDMASDIAVDPSGTPVHRQSESTVDPHCTTVGASFFPPGASTSIPVHVCTDVVVSTIAGAETTIVGA